MTWIRVDVPMPGNHKTLGFRDRLSIPIAQAIGHLVLIWLWMADEHWDGQLGKVPNEEIERAAIWHGEPQALALAFRDYYCFGNPYEDSQIFPK
jgi:hypothetical protein